MKEVERIVGISIVDELLTDAELSPHHLRNLVYGGAKEVIMARRYPGAAIVVEGEMVRIREPDIGIDSSIVEIRPKALASTSVIHQVWLPATGSLAGNVATAPFWSADWA
jgi:hypothetical protein